MDINTDSKQKALKRTMKILGKKDAEDRREICRLLTVANEPYSRTQDASSFLKDLVNSEQFPIEREGKHLKRTDLKEVVSQ